MAENGRRSVRLLFWGKKFCPVLFNLILFYFIFHVFSPPLRFGREGRAAATRAAAARAPSLPLPLAPVPCSCPSAAAAAAAREGKREEPAQKAAGQTPTSGRNKRRQRRPLLPSFPVAQALPAAAAPLQTRETPERRGPPPTIPLSHYCGDDYFPPGAHLTVSALMSEGQSHLFSPWELFF